MPTERLKPNDPRCLSPKLMHVDTGGHFAEDDPRRVEAREQYERYMKAASPPEALDYLEGRCSSGTTRTIRQVSPGVYTFVALRSDSVGVRKRVEQIGGAQ